MSTDEYSFLELISRDFYYLLLSNQVFSTHICHTSCMCVIWKEVLRRLNKPEILVRITVDNIAVGKPRYMNRIGYNHYGLLLGSQYANDGVVSDEHDVMLYFRTVYTRGWNDF